MAAKDYKICPAMFNAYIAKVSKKKPNQMTEDRRAITDDEIFTLIEWYIEKYCLEHDEATTIEISNSNGALFELIPKGDLLKRIKENLE